MIKTPDYIHRFHHDIATLKIKRYDLQYRQLAVLVIIAFVSVCSETDDQLYVQEMNYKTAVLCST